MVANNGFAEYSLQVHAGISERDGGPVWHTDGKGNYWCGDWSHRTPRELMNECLTTMRDLLLNHPELL